MAVNTSATSQNHNGTGSQANFAISFPFLLNSEIEVTVDGNPKQLGTDYNIVGSQVQFTSGNIPASGTGNIVFNRNTNISTKRVDFEDGSVLTETDLDNNANQLLFSMQEIIGSGASTVSAVTATTPILSSGGTTPIISISAATTNAAGSMSASDKTKLDGIEASADVTDATNVNAAGAVMNSDATTAAMSFVVDEDNMASDSATKVPTQQSVKKYVDDEVAGVVNAAPAALDTLNELAAALGDDANFSTTVTTSIGTKLPLAGGTMTGNIVMSGSQTVDGRDLSADGAKLDNIEANADVTDTANVNAAGAVMNSDLDGKGELLVGNGSGDPSALSVGTNGYVLKANSSTATGLEWAAESGGTDLSSGGTIDGDLTLTGANYNVVWDKSDNALEFADLAKLTFGNGGDLEIYHNSNNDASYINETGSGSLVITAENFDVQDNNGNSYLLGVHDGALQMYHHGDARLLTTSTGITVYSGASGSEAATGTITSGNIGVTGNITVSGTVDGRDVAADGTKLDGIASGATNVSTENIQDIVGNMVSSNTETGITVTYQDADGTLDFVVASQTDENFTTADHSKLDGIEANADVTDATNVNAAGAVMNSDLDGKGELLVGDGSGDPTALAAGTNGYVLKANSSTTTGLEWAAAGAGGDVNQNAFSNVAVSGQTTVAADSATDTLNIAAGSNITIITDASNDTVTIASTDTNTQLTTEEVQDIVGAMFSGNTETNITATYQDSDGTIDLVSTDTNTTDLASDSSPQLAANLDVQTNEITTSTSNGNIKLNPNGTGVVEIKGDGSSADGTIQLNCSQNSHGVKIKSPPHSANASYTLTLPDNDGNANQVLKTDGSGGLDWVDQTAAYTNASVDAHLNQSNPTSGYVLSWNGSDYAWVAQSSGGGGGGASALNDLSDAKTDNSNQAIGIGSGALAADNGSTISLAIGKDALNDLISANFNCAVGVEALSKVTTTGQNMAFGVYAGRRSVGSSNVFVGYSAGEGATSGTINGINNIALGEKAMENYGENANYNVAIGSRALRDVSGGTDNSCIGYYAGTDITTGDYNQAVGSKALETLTTGSSNSAVGYKALNKITTTDNNTAIGRLAGENATSSSSVFVGDMAGDYSGAGSNKVIIGKNAGRFNTGNNNIIIGANASGSATDVANEITLGDTAITKFRIPAIDFVLKDNGGTPSSGQVLTADSNGEGYWANASGGGGKLELISSTTFTSAVSAITFTSISGYTQYKIIFNLETSGAGTLEMRVGIDGTYDSGTNYVGPSADTSILILGGFSATSKKGEINIFDLNQAEDTLLYASGVGLSNDTTSANHQTSGGRHNTTTAQNCIQLFGSSGNISSGTVSLYGIATS